MSTLAMSRMQGVVLRYTSSCMSTLAMSRMQGVVLRKPLILYTHVLLAQHKGSIQSVCQECCRQLYSRQVLLTSSDG